MNIHTFGTEQYNHQQHTVQPAQVCWCGQELEYTRSTLCPRCGSARPPGTPVAVILPAV
jgi:hypothetical protein